MPDPIVSICRDRTVSGLSSLAQLPEIEPLEHLPLSELLLREFETDAHLLCYHAVAEDGTPVYLRINKRSPAPGQLRAAGCGIRTTLIVLDWDLPDHRAWSGREEVDGFVATMAVAVDEHAMPAPTAFYTTKGGARLVYALTEPIEPERAEGIVAGLIRDWKTVGLELDEKCTDWTRLFRAPRVMRDGKPTSGEFYFEVLSGGPELDPNSIAPADVAVTQTYVDVELASGDMPTLEQVHDLLYEPGKGTREKMTPWLKEAKTWLQGRDAFDVCFKHAPIDETKGRNNELTRLIGSTVGMLYTRPGASPEGIYALFHDAVDQLQPDANTPSWHRVAWDIVLRMWNSEAQQQAAAVQAVEQEKVAAQEGVWPAILEKLTNAHPDIPTLRGPQHEAIAWASGRLIAAAPKGLYLMRRDGTYSPYACSPELLQATIRDMGMSGAIETHHVVNRVLKPKSAQDLVNAHAVPVHRVECTPNVPHTMIEERGDMRALVLKVHQLRADLEPRPDRDVQQWLEMIGGIQHDELLEWLAHSLDVGRGICALALVGASGAGKGMLAQGLAECFQGGYKNDERALGTFNVGLLDSPVVHCDESIPSLSRTGGMTPDQQIRKFVSGGHIPIEPKGKDIMHALIYPRVLITANNIEVISQLCGRRDLGDEDLKAISQRLLYIDVPAEAARWLCMKGNHAFTRGWVAGERGNDYKLARHILWLHENRKPSLHTSGRLLVEGGRTNKVIQDYAIRTPHARAVIRTLLQMIEAQQTPDGMAIFGGEIHVVPGAVAQWYEKWLQIYMHIELGTKAIGNVLRLVSETGAGTMPRNVPGSKLKQRWFKLRLETLLAEAISSGYTRTKLERYYVETHGQEALDLELARAAAAGDTGSNG